MTTCSIIAFVFTVTLAANIVSGKRKEVCYPVLGCFNTDPPFDNARAHLPQSPYTVMTSFHLYTRDNTEEADYLLYMSPRSILQSHFNSSRLTKFIIHGVKNDESSQWIINMRKALIEQGDYNVIVVYWGKGAPLTDYPQATANVRLVATEIKVLIRLLERLTNLQLADVHFIGHSLGAHASGYAGSLLGDKVGRITGLDPADPNFQDMPEIVRLDQSDAKFVDVIHTNGMKYQVSVGFGLMIPSGHIDFYVNGGEQQKGCTDGVEALLDGVYQNLLGRSEDTLSGTARGGISCSHSRAHELFVESLSSPCKFKSFPCDNYDAFRKGKCFDCEPSGCSEAGFFASNHPTARGKHFLITFGQEPFCGSYYYQLSIQVDPSQSSTRGDIYVFLLGRSGSFTKRVALFGRDTTKLDAKDINVVIVLNKSLKQLGDEYRIDLVYKRRTGTIRFLSRASTNFRIQGVELIEAATGARYLTDKKSYVLHHRQDQVLILYRDTQQSEAE
ncbi:pancreatic lipase-related protein 2 [Plakobranchus ocellatus]|uniref:Pancreatic lipase-related protein 2 n=1 Tax=Plakobranchus ocellatus TaxID=259542 RepID=A0AAV4BJU2_9GAST|nr:pancreatic lipase-related protein 2 [Plakobranchus ocellatus]